MNYVDRDKKSPNSENTSCIPNYVIERPGRGKAKYGNYHALPLGSLDRSCRAIGSKILSCGMVRQGISRRVLRGTTYNPGH
jgi:hypothetical protein